MLSLFQIERQRESEALNALHSLFAYIINPIAAVEYGIIVFSLDGDLLAINQRWQQFFNIGFDDIRSYNITEDGNLKNKPIWQPINQAFDGKPGIIEDHYFNPVQEWGKPGKDCWIRGCAFPIFDGSATSKDKSQLAVALFLRDCYAEKNRDRELLNLLIKVQELEKECQTLSDLLGHCLQGGSDCETKRPKTMPSTTRLRAAAASIPRREREVFERLAAGSTVKEVAHGLKLGVKSVYTYRARLLSRLNLASDVELALAWREIYGRRSPDGQSGQAFREAARGDRSDSAQPASADEDSSSTKK